MPPIDVLVNIKIEKVISHSAINIDSAVVINKASMYDLQKNWPEVVSSLSTNIYLAHMTVTYVAL